jgi:MarR family transcriptional regulator, negative regulator of the multidrug operon emrRAB
MSQERMVQSSERLINLFGALALGVTDRIRQAALEGFPLGGETAAALVVIGHAPGLSIDQLGHILGLSHPGTVRLVDRLAAAGFAMRSPGSHDRRAVALELTDAGLDQRVALLERRRATLASMLDGLSFKDQAALERIARRMVGKLPQDATSALTVCRFCNEQLCDDCPMESFGIL